MTSAKAPRVACKRVNRVRGIIKLLSRQPAAARGIGAQPSAQYVP